MSHYSSMQYVRSGRADDTGPTRTDRHRHEPGRDRLRAGRRMKLQQQPWSRCDTEASRTRARKHCARAPDRRCEREMTASDRCESAYSTSEPDGPRPRTRTTAPIGIKPDHDSRLGSNRPQPRATHARGEHVASRSARTLRSGTERNVSASLPRIETDMPAETAREVPPRPATTGTMS